MIKIFDFIVKVFAGINCLFLKVIFSKKLDISLPSISFAYWPFRLYLASKTVIGKRAIIAQHCEIISMGIIIIGDNFCINKYSRIVAHEKIIIGRHVTIAQFVSILDHDHAYLLEDGQLILNGYKTAPIEIGDNVWIGDKVTICKGVKIGSNVIIGANSVVTNDIKDNCIAAGVPCKKIKSI